MKKVISFIIGLIAISGILSITIYTLTHKEIRQNIENKKTEILELVNSTYNNHTLSELYNITLNDQRHKLKLEYKFELRDIPKRRII